MPQGLTGEPEGVQYEKRRTENSNERGRKDKKRKNIKDKEWILKKKDVSAYGDSDTASVDR